MSPTPLAAEIINILLKKYFIVKNYLRTLALFLIMLNAQAMASEPLIPPLSLAQKCELATHVFLGRITRISYAHRERPTKDGLEKITILSRNIKLANEVVIDVNVEKQFSTNQNSYVGRKIKIFEYYGSVGYVNKRFRRGAMFTWFVTPYSNAVFDRAKASDNENLFRRSQSSGDAPPEEFVGNISDNFCDKPKGLE